jgi:cytoskeletal protein CcmA (bactofilin family)
MLGVTTAHRVFVFAFLSLAFLAAPAGSLAGEGTTPSQGDQIVLSGTVTVPRGQVVGEVVVLHGMVVIEGVATGDVVILDGSIVVQGQVSGSVIALHGSIHLGPNAQVRGDVMAGGDVQVEQGAKVEGTIRQHTPFTWRASVEAVGRFATWLAVTVSTLALGLLLLLFVPRAADAVHEAVRTAPWASLGWGAALFVGVPILSVAAVATLLGLPLGLVVLLALAFVCSVGYVWTAWAIGRLLWRPPRNRPLALAFGWLILRAVALIPYVGGIAWAAGSLYGVGAMSVATWRARATGGKHRARPTGAQTREWFPRAEGEGL